MVEWVMERYFEDDSDQMILRANFTMTDCVVFLWEKALNDDFLYLAVFDKQ